MAVLIFFYTLAVIIFCRKIIKERYFALKNELDVFKKFHNVLITQEKNTLIEKNNLEAEATKIFALYEITKDISKALKDTEALEIFKEEIGKYLQFEDCILLGKDFDSDSFKDYFIQDLQAEKRVIGHLAIRGIKGDDKEKFIILVQQFALVLRRIRLYERIEELAITDSLTHVFTRRYALERLNEELSRSSSHKLQISFLMIDIDNFKGYNDKFGHLVGDAIIKAVASGIKSSIREIDLLGRFGGEEFLCILPETTKEGANFAAERIRKAIEDKEIKAYDEVLKATVSVGVATFPSDASSLTELIDKADWALYRAKKMGKNRVCSFAIF